MEFGYAIAPDAEAVAALAAVQPRWSVNGLALAVIEALIPRIDLAAWADAVTRGREGLPAALGSRGLDVIDTDACWVLVEHSDLRWLLIPHGVLVRDCSSFGLDGLTRIGLPDDAGYERLLDSLDAVLA